MRHEIIHTADHLLVVDDSEIKKGDWFYNRVLSQSIKVQGVWLDKVDNLNSNLETFKVIAHLPLNNSPILEGVDVLPPTEEDDVEKLALEYSGDLEDTISNVSYDAYIKGYNKAKEKYEYTKEDMRKIFEVGIGLSSFSGTSDSKFQYALKFLSQPKMPIAFECAYQSSEDRYYEDGVGYTHNVKRTTNNLGQTQWVGKYIYA